MAKGLNRREFLMANLLLGAGVAAPGVLSLLEYRRARGQNRTLHAAFSTAGMAGTWNQQGRDAAYLMAKWLDIDIEWFDGQWDAAAQRAAMSEVAKRQWDFVAVQPNSIGALVDSIRILTKANIPVVDMDTLIAPLSLLPQLGVLTFIAPDNVSLAEAVVQRLVNKMGGSGKIAQTWGQLGHTGAQGRAQGFYNVLKNYPNIVVVDDQPGDWLVDRATEIWEILLKRHPDLKAGFLHNDDMALAARQVVEKAGLQDQIVLGGIDGMLPAIQAVKEGKLLATARNSAPRIHSWGVLAGYYAATMGLEKARQDIPSIILADSPVISSEIDNDPTLVSEPWKLRAYGRSMLDGYMWVEQQLFF
jgi:ribose transport system substrate-binding protein